ncbi:hypothetical protein CBR_g45831 [Chara braunii]|uniref:CCHC-type domain-containing protein n=1 Tax=Chara braunii TaxID=69332 RepID=A0A388LZD6_CHABU|nr:hypothetical protein CBR_g45831 [Chara braunii]|eukprot:GBG87677.1 hypothetical protein CBR_g45831 [Chara braunii]
MQSGAFVSEAATSVVMATATQMQSGAFVSEAATSVVMATATQQTSQAGSSGSVGSTVEQTLSQSSGLMASQPLVMTPEEVAIQRAANCEAQLQQALGEIQAEKERLTRRRARMQRRQAGISELEEMDPTEMEDDVRTIRNRLAGEANINTHNFPSFSKKALDLEAKIGHGHNPMTDGRKKSLPPNWKAKGCIMFVDNDGSTIEFDDEFPAGVGSKAGSVEASGGGVVAVVAHKGKATGRRRGGSRSRSQVDPNAPPWEKAGLTEDEWRDRYTRQACIRCGQYGHNQFKCRNKKVTEKIPPTMGQALGSSAPVGSNVASSFGTTPGNTSGQ